MRSYTFISIAHLPVFMSPCWESFQVSSSWKLAWNVWFISNGLYRKSKNLNLKSLFSYLVTILRFWRERSQMKRFALTELDGILPRNLRELTKARACFATLHEPQNKLCGITLNLPRFGWLIKASYGCRLINIFQRNQFYQIVSQSINPFRRKFCFLIL